MTGASRSGATLSGATVSGATLSGVGITKHFGGLLAVDDVSITAEPGRVTALIGPNGAGKTTLFSCLSGTERPDTGQVLLDGADITRLSPDARARRGVGRTFQRLAVFPTMTVADNLRVAAESRTRAPAALRVAELVVGAFGFTFDDARANDRRVTQALDLLGIGAVRDTVAGALPTGLLRLVELGRALCNDPRVLLLDEPASGLDSIETVGLQQVIRRVASEGMAVLLVEHDVDLVFGVADRVYAMAEGRLLAAGSPDEVQADALVQQAYLGSAAT